MRCKGLTSEDGAVRWHWGFKAFGVDTPIGVLTLFLALFRPSDAGDVAKEISESAAEDVAFVVWHLQRFMDGVGEAVASESEVLEHGGDLEFCLFFSPMKLMKSQQML